MVTSAIWHRIYQAKSHSQEYSQRVKELKTTLWRLWAKALGEKSGDTDQEADRIALIRTIIVLTYIITNLFIVAGVIRHW